MAETKKISIDDIERCIVGDDRRAVEILPDGSVVVGEREEEPKKPLTYREAGLGWHY